MKKIVCFLLCLLLLCATACSTSEVQDYGDTSGVVAEPVEQEPVQVPEVIEPTISLPVEEDAVADNLSDFMKVIYTLMCDKQDAYLDGKLNGVDGKSSYVNVEDTSSQWHPGVELVSASFSKYGEGAFRDFLEIYAFDDVSSASDNMEQRLDDVIVNRVYFVRDFDADGATYYVESEVDGFDYRVTVVFVHDKYVVHVESEHSYTSDAVREYDGTISEYEEREVLPLCIEGVNTQLADYGIADWFSLTLSMVAR